MEDENTSESTDSDVLHENVKISKLLGPLVAATLKVTGGVTLGFVCTVMTKVKFFEEQLAEIKKLMKAGVVDYIKKNGPFVLGSVKWYVGVKKKTKVKDNKAMLGLLLDKAGGDLDRVAAALSSDAFKVSDLRELLGDEFDKYVETVEVDEAREGKQTAKDGLLPTVTEEDARTLQSIPLYIVEKANAKRRAASEAAEPAPNPSGASCPF